MEGGEPYISGWLPRKAKAEGAARPPWRARCGARGLRSWPRGQRSRLACRATPRRADFEPRGSTRARTKKGCGLRLLILLIRRLLVLALGIFAVWFIVFVVFRATDQRLPWILALALTYAVAAYVILPRVVRMSLKILQRKSVPSFTLTGDGFPGDPVNLALVGTFAQLRAAFATAGWTEADPLGLKSSWGMVVAFVLNRPYPAAPFSTLYLFGRGQDVGFQKAIDGSPRKRHHIRFWALSAERAEEALNTAAFWLNADRPPLEETVLWVGAGTQGHRLLADQIHLPGHPCDRQRRRRRTRFHHRRAEAVRRSRRGDLASGRRAPEPRAGQPLCRRRRGRRGEAGVRNPVVKIRLPHCLWGPEETANSRFKATQGVPAWFHAQSCGSGRDRANAGSQSRPATPSARRGAWSQA